MDCENIYDGHEVAKEIEDLVKQMSFVEDQKQRPLAMHHNI